MLMSVSWKFASGSCELRTPSQERDGNWRCKCGFTPSEVETRGFTSLRMCKEWREKGYNWSLGKCLPIRSWKGKGPASFPSLSWYDLHVCISSTYFFSYMRLCWIYLCRKSNCNIPGCFFRDIENSERYSGRNFNKNKNELVQRIYSVMNRTVFSNKVEALPEYLLCAQHSRVLRCADALIAYFLPLRSVSLDGEMRRARVKEIENVCGL